MKTQKHDPVAEFYNDPSPRNAVALAIADARNDGNGTPEFFAYLNKARDQLEHFPEMHAALCNARNLIMMFMEGAQSHGAHEILAQVREAISNSPEP